MIACNCFEVKSGLVISIPFSCANLFTPSVKSCSNFFTSIDGSAFLAKFITSIIGLVSGEVSTSDEVSATCWASGLSKLCVTPCSDDSTPSLVAKEFNLCIPVLAIYLSKETWLPSLSFLLGSYFWAICANSVCALLI